MRFDQGALYQLERWAFTLSKYLLVKHEVPNRPLWVGSTPTLETMVEIRSARNANVAYVVLSRRIGAIV